jgi:thioredoxin 1
MSIEVLKFSASWCTPCKVLSATLKDVEGLKEIDIDQNRELTAQYTVRSVPTLIFLQDGKEVERTTGSIPLARYEEIINRLNNK